MVDVTSLFMSLFLTTDLSQTEVFGNFLKYISELSDFRESVRSVNECEYKKKSRKICAKGNDVITDVICASQHFASTFSMQIFKFQRRTTERRGVIYDGKRSENFTADRTSRLPPRHQSAPDSLLTGLSRSTTESSVPAPLNQSCLSLWSCYYLIF